MKMEKAKPRGCGCNPDLPRTREYFHRDNKSPDGLKRQCKRCRSAGGATADHDTATNITKSELSRNGKQSQRHSMASKQHLVTNAFVGTALFVLFVGGFVLSTMNGMFAFVDTANILAPNRGYVVAIGVAAVLTMGTALTLQMFLQGMRRSRVAMLVLFVGMQGLNLMINYTGVKRRLAMVEQNRLRKDNTQKIEQLRELRERYEQFIARYPTTNRFGQPVIWKKQVTAAILAANRALQQVTQEIGQLRVAALKSGDGSIEVGGIKWRLVWAWLLIPELSMMTALLGMVGIKKEEAQ